MALRNSKDWRRSRSQSFFDNLITTPPVSPGRRAGGGIGGGTTTSSTSRRVVRRFTHRFSRWIGISTTCSFIIFLILLIYYYYSRGDDSSSVSVSSVSSSLSNLHPNFDFDHQDQLRKKEQDERDQLDNDDDNDEEEEEEEGEEEERPRQWKQVIPQTETSSLPFLPFTCDTCSPSPSPNDGGDLYPPTCSKYREVTRPRQSSSSSSSSKPLLDENILDRSIMFQGTGVEVRRVLKRAFKSSLYRTKRIKQEQEQEGGGGGSLGKFLDEEPFRILVLGGSVSNCRGVDQKTTCWHAGLLGWFQQNLPMEGDRDLVPDLPPLLVTRQELEPLVGGPVRLDGNVKTKLLKRAATKQKTTKKKKQGGGKKKNNNNNNNEKKRQKPSTRLINGSKSATGSSFFAYCYEEEMNIRGKNFELGGQGPDLIILEYGVNDVYPHDEIATRDFEKHLRYLRSLPSKPAIVILEAASLLLATTTSFTKTAEYLHLPAAQFYDVPVLSAKQALFGPQTPFPSSSPSRLEMKDLFLPDQHHPNEKGHELMKDILINYLERQACLAQKEILESITHSSEPLIDVIGKRSQEMVLPLPKRSLFTLYPSVEEDWVLPRPNCIQVGNSKSTIQPISNVGWEKFGWARDKQYLIANKPGSTVSYSIKVGLGGTILVDWLRSRFYDLGDVEVYLDQDQGDRSKVVRLTGYWDLGWSIGVPTEIFNQLEPGLHTLTFKILPSSQSSHPSKKTSFRLIGIIST